MVLLQMTPAVVAAVRQYHGLAQREPIQESQLPPEPSLDEPVPGRPISHHQIIVISSVLSAELGAQSEQGSAEFPYSLNLLLRGTRVFVAAKPPKPKPTKEYQELMARLRREEESRTYERMTSQSAHSISGELRTSLQDLTQFKQSEDDEMTYSDVNRQLTLIINILVTIIACGIAIWLVASHWSAPKRLALSMGASALLGVAEVVIYSGYIRRLSEAKENEKKLKERKSVSASWVIHGKGGTDTSERSVRIGDQSNDHLRRRKKG